MWRRGVFILIIPASTLHLSQDIPSHSAIDFSDMEELRPAQDVVVVVLEVVVLWQTH
jgi:hypothetical protein